MRLGKIGSARLQMAWHSEIGKLDFCFKVKAMEAFEQISRRSFNGTAVWGKGSRRQAGRCSWSLAVNPLRLSLLSPSSASHLAESRAPLPGAL